MKVSHRRRIVVALLAVAVAAGVVFSGRATWNAVHGPGAEVGAANAPAPSAGVAGASGTAGQEPSLAASGDPAQTDDYEDNPLHDVIHQVLANDPQLTAFMHYYNRPL